MARPAIAASALDVVTAHPQALGSFIDRRSSLSRSFTPFRRGSSSTPSIVQGSSANTTQGFCEVNGAKCDVEVPNKINLGAIIGAVTGIGIIIFVISLMCCIGSHNRKKRMDKHLQMIAASSSKPTPTLASSDKYSSMFTSQTSKGEISELPYSHTAVEVPTRELREFSNTQRSEVTGGLRLFLRRDDTLSGHYMSRPSQQCAHCNRQAGVELPLHEIREMDGTSLNLQRSDGIVQSSPVTSPKNTVATRDQSELINRESAATMPTCRGHEAGSTDGAQSTKPRRTSCEW